MTEAKLAEFIEDGGINKIGHLGFTLLAIIVNKAKQQNYNDKVEIEVSEMMFKGKIKSYTQLKKARDILIKNKIIEKYENKRGNSAGTFSLKYD